jgi:hypothetical protein
VRSRSRASGSTVLKLDVLALSKEVLGYTNLWYESALHHATPFLLPDGRSIRLITAPYFLGTKMEAFRGRGRMDFLASHDLEDFVAVIDGRNNILDEVAACPADLRSYLAETAKSLLDEPEFLDALPGYILDEGRVAMMMERLRLLTRLNC